MGKIGRFFLDFFACFLLPAYTLLFAGSVEWFGTNFSVIAVAGADHYRGFVWWGVLAGGYFFAALSALAFSLPRRGTRSWVRLLAVCAVLSLAYAVAIPYLPAYFPKYAALHVLLAAASCVLLMLDILIVLLALRRRDRARWTGPLRAWGGTVAGCGLIFLAGGMVTTALEVFFTISAALLVRKTCLLTAR